MSALLRHLSFLCLGVLLTSCFTMVDLQEAEVMDWGDHQLGLSGGYFVPAEDNADLGVDGGLFYKAGLGGNFELTGRASWLMSLRFDLKYQFYENPSSTLFLASGLNMETSAFTFEEEFGNVKLHAPFYITYKPAPWLSFYGNAKYIYQVPRRFQQTQGLHLVTYNTGLRLGEKAGMMMEINHVPFYNEAFGIPVNYRGLSQVHAGFFVNF